MTYVPARITRQDSYELLLWLADLIRPSPTDAPPTYHPSPLHAAQVASIYHDRETLMAGREAEAVAQKRVLESAAALAPPRRGDELEESSGAALRDPYGAVRYAIPTEAPLDGSHTAKMGKTVNGLRWGATSGKIHTHEE